MTRTLIWIPLILFAFLLMGCTNTPNTPNPEQEPPIDPNTITGYIQYYVNMPGVGNEDAAAGAIISYCYYGDGAYFVETESGVTKTLVTPAGGYNCVPTDFGPRCISFDSTGRMCSPTKDGPVCIKNPLGTQPARATFPLVSQPAGSPSRTIDLGPGLKGPCYAGERGELCFNDKGFMIQTTAQGIITYRAVIFQDKCTKTREAPFFLMNENTTLAEAENGANDDGSNGGPTSSPLSCQTINDQNSRDNCCYCQFDRKLTISTPLEDCQNEKPPQSVNGEENYCANLANPDDAKACCNCRYSGISDEKLQACLAQVQS